VACGTGLVYYNETGGTVRACVVCDTSLVCVPANTNYEEKCGAGRVCVWHATPA
jgi:hypothetical protein